MPRKGESSQLTRDQIPFRLVTIDGLPGHRRAPDPMGPWGYRDDVHEHSHNRRRKSTREHLVICLISAWAQCRVGLTFPLNLYPDQSRNRCCMHRADRRNEGRSNRNLGRYD